MPHLTNAIASPPFVFVSGRLALGPNGKPVAADVGAQTDLCLVAVEDALKPHGLDRRHVVKTTIWITAPAHFADFDERYALFFGDIRPARSTVVSDLVIPGCLVEIEAIARLER